MNQTLAPLAHRRAQLLAQIAQQRVQLGQHADDWCAPIALIDRGFHVVCYIKQHPLYTIGASLGVFSLMHSNQISKWIHRSWATWQIVQKLRGK